ncbi:MAG: hypothetical protein R2851_13780 [Caldilineaceae bacterium]
MRIKSLHLKNIGPFEEADLEVLRRAQRTAAGSADHRGEWDWEEHHSGCHSRRVRKTMRKLERDLRRRGAEDVHM